MKEITVTKNSENVKSSYGRGFFSEDLQRIEMDAVLAYKNYLALEDHILENLAGAVDEDREDWEKLLAHVRNVRTRVMPDEVDKRYHCAAKHAAAALMGLEELHKAAYTSINDPDANVVFDDMLWEGQMILTLILEKLWGHEIEHCKRCK